MKLSEFSGDSTVLGVSFENGFVKCLFDDYEKGQCDILIPTQKFYSEAATESGTVHVRIIDLKEKLPLEPNSGIYCAPTSFAKQMQAAREGFLLSVGLYANEWPLFLQIRGCQLLVACPIQSEESVRVQICSSSDKDGN